MAITRCPAPWQMQCPGRDGPPAKYTEPKPEEEVQGALRTVSNTLATKEKDQPFSVYLRVIYLLLKSLQ